MHYNGKKYTKIAKGTFTTCYVSPDKKSVLLKTDDVMKHALAEGAYVDCYLFPKVDVIEHGLYEMQYYPSTKGILKNLKSKRQKELFRLLRGAFEVNKYTKRDNYYSYWYNIFDNLPAKFGNEKEYLLYTLMDLSNYGTVNFEFQPRNLRVHKGKLLLLDCFFCTYALRIENQKQEQRLKERASYRYY